MANSAQIPYPAPIKLSANVATEWKRFRGQWENFEVATDLASKSTAKRAAIFLACVGTEAYELFQTFQLSVADAKKINKVLEAFERYCIGETNVTYERYIFNRRMQDSGETFDIFLSDLRRLVRTCEYGTLEESIVRDRIVMGVRNDATRKKLLQTRNLDLKQAIDICKSSESATRQLRDMTSGSHEVHAVQKQGNARRNEKRPRNKSRSRSQDRPENQACQYCNRHHRRAKEACPAYNKTCNNCRGRHHFSSVCKASQRRQVIHEVESDMDEVFEVSPICE